MKVYHRLHLHICWSCNQLGFTVEHCIPLSSAEAEYLALSEGAREMIWLQRLLGDLKVHQSEYNLFCDSRSAIFMAHNHSSQCHSKHVDAHAHFVRHAVDEGKLNVVKIDTKINLADIFMKVVSKEKFECARTSLGLVKKR